MMKEANLRKTALHCILRQISNLGFVRHLETPRSAEHVNTAQSGPQVTVLWNRIRADYCKRESRNDGKKDCYLVGLPDLEKKKHTHTHTQKNQNKTTTTNKNKQ